MATLSPTKLAAVRGLVEMVPDETIVGLTRALADAAGHGPLGAVRDMVRAEATERSLRNTVLAPVVGLCRGDRPVGRLIFPSRVMRRLWAGLKAEAPGLVAEAGVFRNIEPDEPPPPVLDALCEAASEGLRARSQPDFIAAAEACDAAAPGGAEAMAGCLDLARVIRSVLPQLDGWVGRMTEERVAAARLAFRDAVAIGADAGPKFVEMLASRLEEPWLALRIISIVMDRPAERYLAASEMACFAEDVLGYIDAQIAVAKAFDPASGPAGGRAAGRAVHRATLAIADFEDCVGLSRELPWGTRIANQKNGLARAVEDKLNLIDNLVGVALPLETVRFAGRMTKTQPKLAADPDAGALNRAHALLAFADEVRSAAATAGFGSSRAKALEKVNERLSTYTEDLLAHLRGEEQTHLDRARLYLEAAAGMIALAADERAAQIVRRRAAA